MYEVSSAVVKKQKNNGLIRIRITDEGEENNTE